MKTLIAIATFVFLGTSLVSGQRAGVQKARSLLLEARYLGVGMSGIEGEHIIARIYSDGEVEYEDLKSFSEFPRYYLRTAKLTKKELTDLSRLLSSADLGSLSESYPAFSSTIDHRENLTLRFSFRGSIKQVEVVNFKPDLPKASTVYPRKLLSVACWAEFTRKNARVKFLFRESKLCCVEEQLCRL